MAASEGKQLIINNVGGGIPQQVAGGIYNFAAVGTFAGATVNLQMLAPDGVTLITAGAQTTLTTPGAGIAYLAPGKAQATVTGGAPSGLYASLARVVS